MTKGYTRFTTPISSSRDPKPPTKNKQLEAVVKAGHQQAAAAIFRDSASASTPTFEEEARIHQEMLALARRDAVRSFYFWQALDSTALAQLARQTARLSDFGPAERWQHSGRVLEPTETAGVFRVRATGACALDVLVAGGVITKDERAAALRLKRDFVAAGLAPHIIGHYDSGFTFFTVDLARYQRSDKQEAAYTSWRDAIKSLHAMIANVMVSVVCCDETPRAEQQPHLRIGMKRLLEYYRRAELNDNVNKAAARQIGRGSHATGRRLFH